MSGNAAEVLTKPAFRKIEWLKRDIAVERRPDGVIVLKSRIPLKPYEKHIPASLAKWAAERPDRIWLAQRTGADRRWRKLSYGEAKRTVDALTQGILDLKLEPGRAVAILSGNSIEHALMTQAAMQARFPAAPVSPAYSLMSHDHVKLKYLFDLIKPALVMVQDGPTFEKALKALDLTCVTVVHVTRPCEGIASIAFSDLAATPVTKDVEASIAAIESSTSFVTGVAARSENAMLAMPSQGRVTCTTVTPVRSSAFSAFSKVGPSCTITSAGLIRSNRYFSLT